MLNKITNFHFFTSIAAIAFSTTTMASSNIVYLKTDCGTQSDCFTTVDTLLTSIWGSPTLPSENSPLLVDIGPGRFEAGGTFCDGTTEPRGHVSFKGSGKNNTIFEKTSSNRGNVMKIINCDGLNFQDFTIDGRKHNSGIRWEEGGDSNWTNIDVINTGKYAWLDNCNSTGEESEHYWFSSKIVGTDKIDGDAYRFTYRSQCAINWFYGSDIVAINDNVISEQTAIAIFADSGDIRLFGSTVRAIRTQNSIGDEISSSTSILGHSAIIVAGTGKVHMHGGIINATALNTAYNNDVTAIKVLSTSSTVHTPGIAFNLNPTGNGVAKRIVGGSESTVMSPYQWPSNANPPAITSMHGADTFIETDCNAVGECNGEGTETHLMIYNSSCSVDGTWFDSTTGRCRGEI